MYEWKTEAVEREKLEERLNALEQDNWEIFAVIPTLEFKNTKFAFGISAPLPQNVEYDIVARKSKGESL